MELSRNNKVILAGFIFVIYGFIAVVSYGKFNENDMSDEVSEGIDFSFSPKPIENNLEFTIKNNRRDPFLNEPIRSANASNSNSKASLQRDRSPLEKPPITYLGSITDGEGGKGTFALKINGREYIMRIGDSNDGVKLVRSGSDYIYVRWKENTSKIKLSQ